jgi:hypothetical protein
MVKTPVETDPSPPLSRKKGNTMEDVKLNDGEIRTIMLIIARYAKWVGEAAGRGGRINFHKQVKRMAELSALLPEGEREDG